jgi:cell wall-associated NlpC family hydrolase
MRNLGDLRWLNTYVGIPYEFGGRNMDGVDCYGLVKLIYFDQYDIILPDWHLDESELITRANLISSQLTEGAWEPLEEPVDGCFVICSATTAAYHLGLYYGGGVIHAHRGINSVYQPLSRFKAEYKNIQFGAWTP